MEGEGSNNGEYQRRDHAGVLQLLALEPGANSMSVGARANAQLQSTSVFFAYVCRLFCTSRFQNFELSDTTRACAFHSCRQACGTRLGNDRQRFRHRKPPMHEQEFTLIG